MRAAGVAAVALSLLGIVPCKAVAAGDAFAPLQALLREAGAHDVEVVRFAEAGGGTGGAAALVLAAKVAAEPARLIAALAEPTFHQRAVPAFVRADVLQTKATAGTTGPARLINWELEVPLWNFEGQLWLRPTPTGVVLELVAGDLAPGRLQIDVVAGGAGSGAGGRDIRDRRATMVLSGGVAIEKANFVTRRLATRDPLAATAMRVTAMYVMLRALALEAVRTGPRVSPRRRPAAGITTPPEAVGPLAGLEFAGIWAGAGPGAGAGGNAASGKAARATSSLGFGLVSTRGTGRLDRVSVAWTLPIPVAVAQARLVEAGRWRGLPGWRDIEVEPAARGEEARWRVDSGMPFVDFDATWAILNPRSSPFRAQARGGDWLGPFIGVDIERGPGENSVMVYTTNPLLNRTGYLPRRLIEAEPLLEQGLALGLAFVNARALARALGE